MASRLTINPNDADDSDSSDSDYSPVRVPRRSATVSPSARNSFRHFTRRRSDFNLTADRPEFPFEKKRERKHSISSFQYGRKKRRRQSVDRQRAESLRKTNSEPSVEHCTEIDIDTIRQLLQTLPRFVNGANRNSLPRFTVGSDHNPLSERSESGGEELINTEIEELRDAAKSIQSLQRVLEKGGLDRGACFSDNDDASTAVDSASDARLSGISTRLGQPRGVMQFLPSIRSADQFVPQQDTYRNRSGSRKSSAPDTYLSLEHLYQRERNNEKTSPRPRRRAVCEELGFTNGDPTGSDALAGVSRFSRLLKSLRTESRPGSPESHPSISWSPYMYSESASEEQRPENSMLEADILLWKKRSRASLRRHHSVRNLAARELYDTEKSFVEGLEYLMQKYMRPLRQPLECTLIEAGLVDKIFYKIPEILAHHQVLLAALSTRIENWHSDTVLGDVLLAHFSKQSMIETYISFVDNFKFAKAAITQARVKPSFEKYYQRCCRDHRNKLDLDALLISPIQRVPRYELIVKQLLKHTSIEHADHERLMRAQRHVHHLAVAINRHRQQNEQMEQRLMEIEAIVDGLEDLVTTGRNLIRYDIVFMKSGQERKQRCIFTMSDQLIVTSVRRKDSSNGRHPIIQSPDFLDSNRFKLLIKISLDDVEIGKDTLVKLHEAEKRMEVVKEDIKVIKKIIELANLLRGPHEQLTETLSNMETDNNQNLRSLNDQFTNNPDLTNVVLHVTTSNGVETVPIEFGSADKRAIWEGAFKEARAALMNHQSEPPLSTLKSIIAHQTRPGLHFCAATVVPGKRTDSPPSVWVCTSDKFSGQVAVLSVDGEPAVESCAGIGNAAIVAVATVPPPGRSRKRSMFRMDRSVDKLSRDESVLNLDSSDDDSDDSDCEGPTTVWIGNDDGEVFVLNSTERVRTRLRERVARLALPVTAICPSNGSVLVSAANNNHVQLLAFKTMADMSWDLEHPVTIKHEFKQAASPMVTVARGVCFGVGNQLHILDPNTHAVERSATVLPPDESVGHLCVAGAILFVCSRRATTIYAVDSFSLSVLNSFSIAATVRTQLVGREDIFREHKIGCLRVSSLISARNVLWIGTSAGFILSTPVAGARSQATPQMNVMEVGHCGPCRLLLPVPVSQTKKTKKMSLNMPAQQNNQLMVLSCGEGLDNAKGSAQDPASDAVNHMLLWRT